LALERTTDIRLQGGAHVTDRLGVIQILDDIHGVNVSDTSPANQGRLQALVDRLTRPGASVGASGAAGLAVKWNAGEHAWGLSAADVATGGVSVSAVDPVVVVAGGQLSNNTQLTWKALEARQVGLSYAYRLRERGLAVGITVKAIQGAAYSAQRNILEANNRITVSPDFGKPALSWTYGVDAGALYQPAEWIRLGVVGKDLNGPAFDGPQGQTVKLTPQARLGLALLPSESLTLTGDLDLTRNPTLVPTVKSRVVSAGVEQTLWAKHLAIRAGALKNLEDAASTIMPTAGLGVRVWALTADLAAGYDFRRRAALGSVSIGLLF
jgi:hypothetical protein